MSDIFFNLSYKYKIVKQFYLVFIIIACFFSCFSCQKKEITKVPKDVMPLGKMVKVMTDIMYADSYGFNEGFTNKTNSGDYMRAEIYPQIFKKHAVSDSLFYTSYSFYETHPDHLKILMDSLTSVFTKLQSAAVLLEGEEDKEAPIVQNPNQVRDNPNNPFNEEQQKIWNERKKNIREKVEKEKLEKIKKDNPGQ
jgi:hypothetical protein